MRQPRNKSRCQTCGKAVPDGEAFCSHRCGHVWALNYISASGWETCDACGCGYVEGHGCAYCASKE